VAARHAPNHAHAILRKSTLEMYTSDATIHNRRAYAIEPLIGAPHGLGKVITILLPEILIRHALFPLIRLHKDYAAHITVHNVCNSRPQLASFLATNIQPGMQPLPRYLTRLLSTVKMGKTDF
jgi:hypothetical protein